jgi:hypothetical protein
MSEAWGQQTYMYVKSSGTMHVDMCVLFYVSLYQNNKKKKDVKLSLMEYIPKYFVCIHKYYECHNAYSLLFFKIYFIYISTL